MFRSIRLATAVVFLTLATTPAAFGQAGTTSQLSGKVTDASGGVLPGAEIALINNATGVRRETVTDGGGRYVFAQVQPGSYQFRVELSGFKTLVEESVTLQVNTPATLNVVLEIGEITEVVSVSAEAEALNRTDASVGNAFTENQIRQLPLLTRNVVELLSLQPAVNQSGEVAGGRNDQNAVTLDGVNVNDQQSPGAFESVLPIPLDSVQEFRVTTVGLNSNLGRSGGGQVALVTKSGTNAWHGSVYEFHRNTATAANSFFNNQAGIDRENLIRNQFGFTVGGPIVKNRAFFFVNFENRLDRSAASQSRVIPTTAVKNGNLIFRDTSGTLRTYNQTDLQQVDPAVIGVAPAMLQYWSSVPDCAPMQSTDGCDPNQGLDRGLSFTGFRFNAPFQRDDKAYVARFDFNINEEGTHTVSWRGTLADNGRDNQLAQFPGQGARSELLNNSRGFSANYTAVLSPTLTSNFTWGFTRQGIEQSGIVGDVLNVRSYDEPFGISPRAFGRKVPTHNFVEDLTWIKGNHTFQGGVNFRFVENDRFDFGNSFSTYSINNGAIIGLGANYYDNVNAYLQTITGDPTLQGEADTPIIRAGMGLMGTITQGFFTYQFDRTGMPIPRGSPQVRLFGTNEFEFYLQDQWRMTPNFTLTLGLRYSNDTPPWEKNGLQVATTVPLQQFWDERYNNALAGIPSNASELLTFDLSGPENNRESWFGRDNNNFSPRVAFAWSPNFEPDTFWGKLFGSAGQTVIRGGAGIVYDRFGSEMIVNFDALGSVGVATELSYPSFDFITAPRYDGTLPDPVPAPQGGFPNTPDLNFDIITNTYGIADDLTAPYSYLLNFSYAREISNVFTFEVGYVGRLSRNNLAQLDIMSPLNTLVDPASGMNWIDAANAGRNFVLAQIDSGISSGSARRADIAANAGSIAAIPYIENMMPGLVDSFISGSATANFLYILNFGLQFSEADALHFIDRALCAGVFGCHTWFAEQYSTMPTWFNSGFANYHGMTLTLRRRFANGIGFDFNYTWSHSIDNLAGGGAETGADQFGGVILDAFGVGNNRGDSDFDIRQQVNANFVYDLPFGQGRRFGGGVPGWVDQIIGGWQVTGIARYNTGLPSGVGTGFFFTTNYFLTGRGVPTAPVSTEVTNSNNDGVPGLFPDKDAAVAAFRPQRVGETGPRNYLRLDDFFNIDFSVAKYFRLPWENHRIQFRFEMFNAFNSVNFIDASLDPIDEVATFGEFGDTTSPRVIQFGLRYEF